MGVTATTRASFYIYNDEEDIDALIRGLRRAGELFGLGS
jgi:cysteine desulfurase/selenocysteine lyase